MQFCCKRPSETVLLLCSNSFDRFFLVLLPFPINPSKGSPSRTNDQLGLQVAVSGFSLESTRLQERVFSRDSKDLFAVVGLEQIQKTPPPCNKNKIENVDFNLLNCASWTDLCWF